MTGSGAASDENSVFARTSPRFFPIVFDLDGTLVDSAFGIADALNGIGLAREKVEIDTVRALVSGGAAHLVKEALKIGDADVPRALQAFRSRYVVDPCRPEHLYPDVERTLARLRRQGLCLAVCTNKPQTLAERVIQKVGLAQYFDVVIGADPRRPEKPDPTSLLEASARLNGSTPIFVGDSMVDALTAQAAGAPFVHAAYGYGRIENAPIAGVARSVQEAARILDGLLWTSTAPGETLR